MNTKIRSVLWLGILIICLLSGSSFEVRAQNAPITTIGTVINAVSNQQVVVPVTVTGFTGIAGCQLSLEYDFTKIKFISSAFNTLLKTNFYTVGDNDLPEPDGIHHRLIIAWVTNDLVTLPDGSSIVNLTFTYISGSVSFEFIDIEGFTSDYYDNYSAIPMIDTPTSTYYINGSVSGAAASKTLNLTNVFLEGLYDGGSTTVMREAMDDLGSHWGTGIADHITVELHSPTYSNVAYTATDVVLHTDGTATISIPAEYIGSYFISVSHRNSIETTTATTVSFAGTAVNQSFGAQANVFGDNLKQVGTKYCIYGGDVDQSMDVGVLDMALIDNQSAAFSVGYIQEDVDGDGAIGVLDMSIVDNNSSNFISAILPF